MGICCTNATSCSGEISITCKCIGIIIVYISREFVNSHSLI